MVIGLNSREKKVSIVFVAKYRNQNYGIIKAVLSNLNLSVNKFLKFGKELFKFIFEKRIMFFQVVDRMLHVRNKACSARHTS